MNDLKASWKGWLARTAHRQGGPTRTSRHRLGVTVMALGMAFLLHAGPMAAAVDKTWLEVRDPCEYADATEETAGLCSGLELPCDGDPAAALVAGLGNATVCGSPPSSFLPSPSCPGDAEDGAPNPGNGTVMGPCELESLSSSALVLFDPEGNATVAHPAYNPMAVNGFSVDVSGFPYLDDVESVRIYAGDVVVAEAPVGILEGGDPPVKSTEVGLENVPALADFSGYQLRLVDGDGTALYHSANLTLLSNDPLESGYVPAFEPPASVPFLPCAEDPCPNPCSILPLPTLEEELPPEERQIYALLQLKCDRPMGLLDAVASDGASSKVDPENVQSGQCYSQRSYTWANQGDWVARIDLFGNAYNVNDGHIRAEAWARPWTWGITDNCGRSQQFGGSRAWGFGDETSGKTHMVGTGSYNFGFALDYRGGGSDMSRVCRGNGNCQDVGYRISASNGRTFMKTPSAGSPVWEGLNNVNIPQTSSSSVPTTLAKVALEGLAFAIKNKWGGVLLSVLGFAVPDKVAWKNYDPVTRSVDGMAGGGINVYDRVAFDSQRKIVSGQMAWRFKGLGEFDWNMQGAVNMKAEFHACHGCNWILSEYTSYLNTSHKAKVTKYGR